MNAVAEVESVVEEKKERELTAADRCDSGSCGAAAYVKVKGVGGELLFCAHHYNKIMNDAKGYEKMMAFAFEVLDERDFLLGENRLKGEL